LVAELGGPYLVPLDVIEMMDSVGLRRLANNQADHFRSKTWSRDTYIHALTQILDLFRLTGHVGEVPKERPVMPPPRTSAARAHLAVTPPAYASANTPERGTIGLITTGGNTKIVEGKTTDPLANIGRMAERRW
jgi:hypothetical protein